MSTFPYAFGYKQDLPDERDYKYKAVVTKLPESVDLTEKLMPVRDQGSLGACTAFATGAMVEYVRTKNNLKNWYVSPLFTYYATRQIEGTIDVDAGAYVRNALKSAANYGTTKEDYWPYDIQKFTITPPQSAWDDASNHQALVYYRLQQTREDILTCLAEGFPFTFGMMLYESFIQTQCGFIVHNYLPMPNTTTEKFVGGHCMLAVGYFTDKETTYIRVRNSWGNFIGLGGYHNIPLDYFLDPKLAADFWTIRSQEYLQEDVVPIPEPPKPEPIAPPEPPKPEPVAPPEPPKPPEEKEDTKEKIIKWIGIGIIIIIAIFFVLA